MSISSEADLRSFRQAEIDSVAATDEHLVVTLRFPDGQTRTGLIDMSDLLDFFELVDARISHELGRIEGSEIYATLNRNSGREQLFLTTEFHDMGVEAIVVDIAEIESDSLRSHLPEPVVSEITLESVFEERETGWPHTYCHTVTLSVQQINRVDGGFEIHLEHVGPLFVDKDNPQSGALEEMVETGSGFGRVLHLLPKSHLDGSFVLKHISSRSPDIEFPDPEEYWSDDNQVSDQRSIFHRIPLLGRFLPSDDDEDEEDDVDESAFLFLINGEQSNWYVMNRKLDHGNFELGVFTLGLLLAVSSPVTFALSEYVGVAGISLWHTIYFGVFGALLLAIWFIVFVRQNRSLVLSRLQFYLQLFSDG